MRGPKSFVAKVVKAGASSSLCLGAALAAGWLLAASGSTATAAPRAAEPAAGAQAPAAKVKCLKVVYRATNPVPRSRAEEAVTRGVQEVLLDLDGSRIVLTQLQEKPGESKTPESGEGAKPGEPDGLVLSGKYMLRLDRTPPVVYRILEGGTQFTVHSGDLNDFQKDRRIVEKNQIELANRSYTAKEREAFFKESYLKPDGSREVKVARTDGEIVLGKPCEHVTVTENGRVVIDAQVTREKVGARGYFQLYRRLGAFSEEVLAAISEFEGLPLKGKITVVTALPAYDIEVEAVSLGIVLVSETDFDPPEGAVRVDEVPKEISCGQCKKAITVDVEEIPAKGFFDGRWIYFCSEECSEAFADARVGAAEGGAKPPSAGKPSEAGKK